MRQLLNDLLVSYPEWTPSGWEKRELGPATVGGGEEVPEDDSEEEEDSEEDLDGVLYTDDEEDSSDADSQAEDDDSDDEEDSEAGEDSDDDPALQAALLESAQEHAALLAANQGLLNGDGDQDAHTFGVQAHNVTTTTTTTRKFSFSLSLRWGGWAKDVGATEEQGEENVTTKSRVSRYLYRAVVLLVLLSLSLAVIDHFHFSANKDSDPEEVQLFLSDTAHNEPGHIGPVNLNDALGCVWTTRGECSDGSPTPEVEIPIADEEL